MSNAKIQGNVETAKQEVQLVEGLFTPSEANHIVNVLIEQKVNFHKLQRISMEIAQSINPATLKVLAKYDEYSSRKIESILSSGEADFLKWKDLTTKQRCQQLQPLIENLEKNLDEYAKLITSVLSTMVELQPRL